MRTLVLGFIIFTMMAIGVNLSIRKGERGSKICWAGVEFHLINEEEVLVGLPEKFLAELHILGR